MTTADRSRDGQDKTEGEPSRRAALRQISALLGDLHFGSIEIVVHDSRVVQIMRTEKLRVECPPGQRPK